MLREGNQKASRMAKKAAWWYYLWIISWVSVVRSTGIIFA